MAKFYAVGVGAGSGGYITLGALRALEKSDVIAAPVTEKDGASTALKILRKEFDTDGKEIIGLVFPMSRDSAVREKSHTAAAEKIISELNKNKTVAMVTLGDVSVYSTCSYMLRRVMDAGFEAETVAGVPSFCAAADKAMISLCEEREAFAVIPSADTDRIEKYIEDFDTLVIMKAGRDTDKLYALLKKYGLNDNAVVCSDIGMENARTERLEQGKSYGYFTTVIIKKNIDKSGVK